MGVISYFTAIALWAIAVMQGKPLRKPAQYSDDELSPGKEEDAYPVMMESEYNSTTFHFTNSDYTGLKPYADALQRLSDITKRRICLAHNPPGIPEKYKPQQPDLVESFLDDARVSIFATRKYDGFTCYVKKAEGVYAEPMARVDLRSGTFYSFLIPISQHLNPLFSDLDMTLVGELLAVEDGEEIKELGFGGVLKVLKMCLSCTPPPGAPRVRIVFYDIHSMARLNRSAFHLYVPIILKALLKPTSPLVRAALFEQFRVWRRGCFVPEGRDLRDSYSVDGLKQHLLGKSDAHGWEGYVISNPFALEGQRKAFEVDWSRTARDRSSVKCKRVLALKVLGVVFRIWREADQRTQSNFYSIYVFYALHSDGSYRYLTDIWSDNFMLAGQGLRSVVKRVEVPKDLTSRVLLEEARSGLFANAFKTGRDLELCLASFMAELRMSWVDMSVDADGTEGYSVSGLKQIKDAWPVVDPGQLTVIQSLKENKHWATVHQRKHLLQTVGEYSVGRNEVRVLDTSSWNNNPAQPSQPKPPSPGAGASVLGKRPVRFVKPLGVADVVRSIYMVVFQICGVVARSGAKPEYVQYVHGWVKIVAGRMNHVFAGKPREADAMLPYIAWNRFLARDAETGVYTRISGTPLLDRAEPPRILVSMPVPDVIRRMDSIHLLTVRGLDQIYADFKENEMPRVMASEQFKLMEDAMLLASV